MTNLPKELTPELLGLVLGKKVKALELWEDNQLRYFSPKDYLINIDTLTRLMKEWCLKQGHYLRSHITEEGGRSNISLDFENKYFLSDSTEFEAVLKATHWVAKEKGLI